MILGYSQAVVLLAGKEDTCPTNYWAVVQLLSGFVAAISRVAAEKSLDAIEEELSKETLGDF